VDLRLRLGPVVRGSHRHRVQIEYWYCRCYRSSSTGIVETNALPDDEGRSEQKEFNVICLSSGSIDQALYNSGSTTPRTADWRPYWIGAQNVMNERGARWSAEHTTTFNPTASINKTRSFWPVCNRAGQGSQSHRSYRWVPVLTALDSLCEVCSVGVCAEWPKMATSKFSKFRYRRIGPLGSIHCTTRIEVERDTFVTSIYIETWY
jgi:hypothetical protein